MIIDSNLYHKTFTLDMTQQYFLSFQRQLLVIILQPTFAMTWTHLGDSLEMTMTNEKVVS